MTLVCVNVENVLNLEERENLKLTITKGVS